MFIQPKVYADVSLSLKSIPGILTANKFKISWGKVGLYSKLFKVIKSWVKVWYKSGIFREM